MSFSNTHSVLGLKTFQICCVFTANFTGGFLHLTGPYFIFRFNTKMHPQWCCGMWLWNQNLPYPYPSRSSLLIQSSEVNNMWLPR